MHTWNMLILAYILLISELACGPRGQRMAATTPPTAARIPLDLGNDIGAVVYLVSRGP
jgi:hypothetical protein